MATKIWQKYLTVLNKHPLRVQIIQTGKFVPRKASYLFKSNERITNFLFWGKYIRTLAPCLCGQLIFDVIRKEIKVCKRCLMVQSLLIYTFFFNFVV